MLTRIKRILLTQYIGAIVAAILAAQGIAGIINASSYALGWKITGLLYPPHSGFETGQSMAPFQWTNSISIVINSLLHFIVVIFVLRWLFLSGKQNPPAPENNLPSGSQDLGGPDLNQP